MEETDLTALCKSDENVLKRNYHSEIWPKSTPVVSKLLFYLPFPFVRDETDLPSPEEKESRVTLMYCVGITSVTRHLPLSLFAG